MTRKPRSGETILSADQIFNDEFDRLRAEVSRLTEMALSRAVVERTQGLALDGEMEETALYRSLSFFATPPWAARAGAEVIEIISGSCNGLQSAWDPAAGRLHMVHGLRESFCHVTHSDVHDYGVESQIGDFLTTPGNPMAWIDWIVTNPPFPLAADFVRRGLEIATQGVAVLARLAFLESAGRYDLMSRLTVLAPFSERVPMQLGSWDPDLSTATAYAWFVWRKDVPRQPVHMIPPGTKARLTRPSDDAFADGRQVARPLTTRSRAAKVGETSQRPWTSGM